MASSTALVSLRGRARSARLDLGARVDRASAFRRARVHSGLVRLLHTLLPVVAIGLCGYYALSLKLSMGIGGLKLPTAPTFSSENMTMENPRYEGYNKDGGRYLVTAKTAQQDLRSRDAPIQLTGIDGKLLQLDQTATDLKAKLGTFDSRSHQLELFNGIEVVSQNGMKATLTRATVLTKESKIVSREPVVVEMPTGSIRARQMQIDQKARQVTFTDGVAARVIPERKPAALAAATALRGFGSTDAPVDITSERLDIDDASKLATFRGAVRAVQGEAVLVSEELEISYEGSASAPAASGTTQPAAGPTANSRLKRIASRKPVVLTQGSDRITGDSAEFDAILDTARLSGHVVMTSGPDRQARSDRADIDQRADVVVLSGNVFVVQGKNELKGRRLWMDRKAGHAQLLSPAEAGMAAGRIATRLIQSDGGDKAGKRPAAQAAAPAGGLGIAAIKTDPNAPIDVEAVSLDINDTAKTAVYRGDVRVAQGDFKMATPELTAFYVGQMGLAVAPGQARESQAKSPAQPQAQLTRIEARRGVAITSKEGETATGDWADFDTKANTVTLGGDVKLAQGVQVFRGSKLVFDMNTGESRLLMEPGAVARAWAADTQAPNTPEASARPRGVFYPQQFKGIGQKNKEAASAVAPEPQPADAAPRKRRPPDAGQGDGVNFFGTTGGN